MKKKLSLEEIETACILLAVLAVPAVGASTAQTTERLGLAPSMSPPVADALATLCRSGLLSDGGDRWMLTDQGKSHLKELGVR